MPGSTTMRFAVPRPGSHPTTGNVQRLDFTRTDPLDLAGWLSTQTRPLSPDAPALVAERLAQFLARPCVQTFATGDLARRNTLAALLSPGDQVIVDSGANQAMFETVLQTSATLHRAPSGSGAAVERRLLRLSGQPRTGRVFVMVPAVAPLSSVTTDLDGLCALCARYNAILVVDLSQDIGVMGEAGLGVAEGQGCLARIDMILGDLSANFGAPGGIAAVRDPALFARNVATNAPLLSPASAATVLVALDLIDSAEGQRQRRHLLNLTLRLRNHLLADGLPVMGQPSPVVPLRLMPATASALTDMATSAGLTVPLVQAPFVAGHAPRWLIRLNARHGLADIDDLADILRDVIRAGARWQALSPA